MCVKLDYWNSGDTILLVSCLHQVHFAIDIWFAKNGGSTHITTGINSECRSLWLAHNYMECGGYMVYLDM
ncbi:hypothetical protein Lal_00027484, partial [Lupinus albus]